MVEVVLSLGVNQGDRERLLGEMRNRLRETLAAPFRCSSVMETEPLDAPHPTDWFLNQLAAGCTELSPERLLDACQAIENQLGRVRSVPNAPRTADIDVLLYGSEIVRTPRLAIPHPAITERRFCLAGLSELCAESYIPGTGATVRELVSTMPTRVRNQRLIVRSPSDE